MNVDPASTVHADRSIHWPVVILCFLAVLLDGFDTAALAFAIPTLAQEWELEPAAFTLPLVLTNIGAVLGYLSAGFLGSRVGSRRLLIYSVLLFAAGTLLTALILPLESIPLLTALRLLTGLGLGMALPSGITIATKHSALRRREVVSIMVTTGLGFGSVIGGIFGGRMINGIGVAGVFWIGGLLPLVLAGVMTWLLPAEIPLGDAAGTARQEAKVGRLFDPALRWNTALIWAFSFLIFIAGYTLLSWTPTLLTGYGFSATEAPIGLAAVSTGSIIGSILLIFVAAKLGITRALLLLPLIGAVCLVLAGSVTLSDGLLLLVLSGAGLGVIASQGGQLALAVWLYPVGSRTTGVGWAAALGRAGSIIGPGVVGALLALALSAADIILLATIPVLGALVCAIVLWRRTSNTDLEGRQPSHPDLAPDAPH